MAARRGSALWLLVSALALSCASTEERPDAPVVDDLVIEGTKHIKASELEKKILTSESPWYSWVPLVGKEEHFDTNAWTADQRRIERYYQAHGFYQARVAEEEVKPTKEGHVALRLKIQEGEPTTIARFAVTGLEGLPKEHRDEILEKLPTPDAGVFLEEEWLDTQRVLKERMLNLGYAESNLAAEAQVDVGKHIATLDVTTWPGDRYRFGKIHIGHNEEVKSRLIEDQVASAVTAGEWFNPAALEEAQARVFQMGVFSAVKVTGSAPESCRGRSAADAGTEGDAGDAGSEGPVDIGAAREDECGTVPIAVEVAEALFHTRRWGGGLGADPLRNEVHASVLYEDRNAFGGLQRLTLRGRAGYALLAGQSGSFALVSVIRNDPGATHGPFVRIPVELEQPHFLTRALALQGALEFSHELEPAYFSTGGTARISLVARPTSLITAKASLNASIYFLSAPVQLASAPPSLYGCGTLCGLVFVDLSVAWDRRDNVLEPHSGTYAALDFQIGGTTGPFGYQPFNYVRVLPDFRFYASAFENKVTLAGRARAGSLWTFLGATSAIPVRFFSGGNDMRGFSARRLAPFEVIIPAALPPCVTAPTCPLLPAESLPVGGDALLEGSLELRWNLWESLTLATFIDAGYVTPQSLSIELITQLNVAVGVGIRYRTPIGPIRLDLAARLPIGGPLQQFRPSGYPYYAVSQGCFLGLFRGGSDTYAGSPEGQCTFHLSVGEAF